MLSMYLHCALLYLHVGVLTLNLTPIKTYSKTFCWCKGTDSLNTLYSFCQLFLSKSQQML